MGYSIPFRTWDLHLKELIFIPQRGGQGITAHPLIPRSAPLLLVINYFQVIYHVVQSPPAVGTFH